MGARGMTTQSALADQMGVSRQYVHELVSGKKTFRQPFLTALANSGVNLNWLLTGEGPMFRGEAASPAPRPQGRRTPFYDVEAAAGGGALVEEEGEDGAIWLPEPVAVRMGVSGRLGALWVRGDSMEPTLRNGDIAVVDPVPPQVISDGLYLVRFGHIGLAVKRLTWQADGLLRVSSDNPVHPASTVNPREEQTDFAVVGQVTGYIRALV